MKIGFLLPGMRVITSVNPEGKEKIKKLGMDPLTAVYQKLGDLWQKQADSNNDCTFLFKGILLKVFSLWIRQYS
jgi:hypothetical protein